jgi:hypothetical protein
MSQTAPAIEASSHGIVAAFTIEGSIVSSGHALEHRQYVTGEYVVTELGRSVTVHVVRLGGRFAVDPIERRLRPIEPSAQRIQIEHLRGLVGAVSVHCDPDQAEVDGFACRRYRLCNDSSRITIAAEAYCTRVGGIERTALHAERCVEAKLHPFALPLEPDEVVVRSTTRTFTNGYQHLQEYRLHTLTTGIRDRHLIERLLDYPVVED